MIFFFCLKLYFRIIFRSLFFLIKLLNMNCECCLICLSNHSVVVKTYFELKCPSYMMVVNCGYSLSSSNTQRSFQKIAEASSRNLAIIQRSILGHRSCPRLFIVNISAATGFLVNQLCRCICQFTGSTTTKIYMYIYANDEEDNATTTTDLMPVT